MRKLLFILITLFAVKTADAQWVLVSNREAYDLCKAGNNLFAATDEGIFISPNNGLSWTPTGSSNFEYHIVATTGTILFAVNIIEPNTIYRSDNCGANWYDWGNNIGYPIKALAYDGDERMLASVVPYNALYERILYLSNWLLYGLGNEQVYSIAGSNGNPVFAGTGLNGVWRTTNYGINWTQVLYYNWAIIKIAIDGNYVYAMSDNKLWKSTNNGNNWTNILTDTLNSVAANGNVIIVGTVSSGFRVSVNYGLTWQTKNEGLPPGFGVQSILMSNGWVIAGRYLSPGIWRRPIGEITGINTPEISPDRFILAQNHPNPFNPETKIRYEIPTTSFVKLSVNDILGREVSRLVNERQSQGAYEVTWNGSKFPSGVYFYMLTTENFTDTRRMILLK